MTPALILLKKKKIPHKILKYAHDETSASYGLEAAEKLNLDTQCVFKTLVVRTDANGLAVAIVPVSKKLSEKKMAKALGAKKVAMADSQLVEASTGYVLGGISPLGQRKRLVTIMHTSAQNFAVVYVSAGKRGVEVALSPEDLATITRAICEDIAV